MAVDTTHPAANANPSNHMARSIGTWGFSDVALVDWVVLIFGKTRRLSGKPRTIWAMAHAAQVPRQPRATSPHAVSGHPTVLAKPAINVMPVMAERAVVPYIRPSVANAASYSPSPMAAPMTSHPSQSIGSVCVTASIPRPAANSRLETPRTSRPPNRSMVRPTRGPSTADTRSEAENAAKTPVWLLPVSRAMAGAKMAIR